MRKKVTKLLKATPVKKTATRQEKPVKVAEKRKPKIKAEPVVDRFGLHNLFIPKGAHKKKKLLGRGPSSGHGKTSSRGSKGQTSRAGRHFYLGFEGGQSPLIRRMPKRGFTSINKKEFQIVNLRDLIKIKEPAITLDLLQERGLIKDKTKLVKILGVGELKNPVTVQAHAFSKKASEGITKVGGKIELVNV